MKTRLDMYLVARSYAPTRSQAEHIVRLGRVQVNNNVVRKPGYSVRPADTIVVAPANEYVSRAGLKLESVVEQLGISFGGKNVLDVGSSTGGFTDYALQHGAKKVFAVDVGTNQLHPKLRDDDRIELHEKTDIRDFRAPEPIDIVVVDVSFIPLSQIATALLAQCRPTTQILVMVKPQFEARDAGIFHKGVIKNDRMRRDVLEHVETYLKEWFVIRGKADSRVAGSKGNVERFYLLTPTR
jgi:23S rRNA (cytidine1920-2'-O)/16S rRNA (cytidine1409-2'-O)-methyltransferase